MSAPDTAVPKVSVVVMTYNHRRFIEQALDSVLSQRTTFAWELLISEDCSTDGTREVVIDYQRRHPVRIRLLLSERNLRSNAVVARGINAARGQYVAMLDGDDYWIHDDKLQRQADFLGTQAQKRKAVFRADQTRLDEDRLVQRHQLVLILQRLGVPSPDQPGLVVAVEEA